jgi:hypothetical protein
MSEKVAESSIGDVAFRGIVSTEPGRREEVPWKE